MSSQSKLILASFIVLTALSITSYNSFNKYRPKSITPIQEVHGVKSDSRLSLPEIEGGQLLGSTIGDNHKSLNYKSKKTSDEIQQFYRNILFEDNWEINNEGKAGIFTTTEYKKDKNRVKITTTDQKDFDTILTIEIWEID